MKGFVVFKKRRDGQAVMTKETVKYVAGLSRICLSDAELEEMQEELGRFLDYVEILKKLDTEGPEPVSHGFPLHNVLRDDEVRPSYDRAELLKSAPVRTDTSAVVPQLLE